MSEEIKQKESWEEEFEKQLENNENYLYWSSFRENIPRVKEFISSKLAEQKKEFIEIIKTPMSTEFQDPEEESADYSIEDFRTRLLNLIKQD